MFSWYQAKIEVSYCAKKIDRVIPYWITATIDWLIVFNRIRLRKAKYDNPKPCWHIIGGGDSNSVLVDLILSWTITLEAQLYIVIMHQSEKG